MKYYGADFRNLLLSFSLKDFIKYNMYIACYICTFCVRSEGNGRVSWDEVRE